MLQDPGDAPPAGATPKERERWKREREKFLTENFRPLPTERAKVDPTDRRIALMRGEHQRFLEMHSPVTAALQLAALSPAKEVIFKAAQLRRAMAAANGTAIGEYIPPEEPALVLMGYALFEKALQGDTSAITQISDRLEGKPGLRKGDEAEDDPAKRKQQAAIAEAVTRALVEARLAKPGETATVVDAEVVEEK